jgi:hypothetical protein
MLVKLWKHCTSQLYAMRNSSGTGTIASLMCNVFELARSDRSFTQLKVIFEMANQDMMYVVSSLAPLLRVPENTRFHTNQLVHCMQNTRPTQVVLLAAECHAACQAGFSKICGRRRRNVRMDNKKGLVKHYTNTPTQRTGTCTVVS